VLAPLVADRSLFHAIPGLLDALPPDLRAELGPLGTAPREATIAALEAIAAAKASLPPGITLAIAPTIPHHCTGRFLSQCLDIADRHALPIHMHIAESRLQAVVARQLWGVSPIGYLDRLGILRPGFTAAHAVWLDAGDLDILAARGCAVAHIPASNLRLGSGIAHIRPMLDRGITVGLATDGANSSDALSMLQAMRLASYGARAFAGPRDAWLTAAETVRLATAGGADLLGLPQGGRIEPGAPADLAFFDLGHIDFIPLTDPFNQLVTCADGASVTDVMVAGRLVVRDRRITTVDTSPLRDRVAAVLARLGPATAAARALAERLEPHVVAFAARAGALPIDRFIQAAS
jgi:cytosine/adenosine deaminase-related metal-dependent hydrolase